MGTLELLPIFVPLLIALVLLMSVPGESEADEKLTPKDGDEVVEIQTDEGSIVLMFMPEKAPRHVENFKTLANKQFYDGTRFHRTIKGFMVQGGDPNTRDMSKSGSWGNGGNTDEKGKPLNVNAEFNDVKHVRGVLSMARSTDPDSASSQFFIMHEDSPHLDGQYSAFGIVVSGIEVVDKIVAMPADGGGKVDPNNAVVLRSVSVKTWPLG